LRDVGAEEQAGSGVAPGLVVEGQEPLARGVLDRDVVARRPRAKARNLIPRVVPDYDVARGRVEEDRVVPGVAPEGEDAGLLAPITAMGANEQPRPLVVEGLDIE